MLLDPCSQALEFEVAVAGEVVLVAVVVDASSMPVFDVVDTVLIAVKEFNAPAACQLLILEPVTSVAALAELALDNDISVETLDLIVSFLELMAEVLQLLLHIKSLFGRNKIGYLYLFLIKILGLFEEFLELILKSSD